MSVAEKIDEVYILYCLSGRNVKKTLTLTNIRRPTLNKYIMIKERLDLTLFDHLDQKKGQKKLTLEMAMYICKNVLNPEYQNHIFGEIQGLPKIQMKQRIHELSECLLCADQSCNFELTPCCGQFLCEGCLSRIALSEIEDLTFKPIKCPFCRVSFTLNELKRMMVTKHLRRSPGMDLWQITNDYYGSLTFNYTYSKNLYNKFMRILEEIEFHLGLIGTEERMKLSSRDYEGVIGTDIYYGCCTSCTPDTSKTRNVNYQQLRISSVEKQCAMGDGELVVLDPGQFLCTICKSFLEDPEDGTFKKCPHCGINTLRPEGCNYVRCGDHRWCFICNERLENNPSGHNEHYYTGLPRASAYASSCRQSLNQEKPKFILKTCDCSGCKDHDGAPLCRELECMNRTSKDKDSFKTLCEECDMKRKKNLSYEKQIAKGLLTNFYSRKLLYRRIRGISRRRNNFLEPDLPQTYYGRRVSL